MRLALVLVLVAGCDALFRIDAVAVGGASDASGSAADAVTTTGPRVVFVSPQQPCEVWTNTSADSFPVDGTDVTMDCYDWSSSMQGSAPAGYSRATISIWSYDANDCASGIACTAMARLYCVQQ